MSDLPDNFGENVQKNKPELEPGQVVCYGKDCNNVCVLNESCFCSPECKASYYGTSVDKIHLKPTGRKKSLEEWIAIFHERAKSAKIEVESDGNNVAELVDFLSTPLGEEYARKPNIES